MKRLSVATHLAIALALITGSLVMAAHSLGLVPDPRASHVQTREAITDLLARCVVDAVGKDNFDQVGILARDLAARDPDIVSIGIRRADGTLVVSTPGHREGWREGAELTTTLPYARVPIMRDGEAYVNVEIRFRELNPGGARGLLSHPLAPLVLFCIGAGFGAYRLFLRRALRYLDPTAVIPERVRLVLDSLVEGVIMIDTKERIVLINRAFSKMSGRKLEDVIGQKASSFTWIDMATAAPPVPLPWVETAEDGALRAGIRVSLVSPEGRAYHLTVACAPIIAPNGRCRGVAITLADQTETDQQRIEMEHLLRNLSASQQEIARQNKQLLELATTDPLTQCFNRRGGWGGADQCWAMSRRQSTPVACIMIDVDHFKQINDQHGHQVGDRVLRALGEMLRVSARDQDIVGRYGGEEFCMVLPETDAAAARIVAERVRIAIESQPTGGLTVTISLGVADSLSAAAALEDIFARADNALYAAKRAGRNRVELFSGQMRDAA